MKKTCSLMPAFLAMALLAISAIGSTEGFRFEGGLMDGPNPATGTYEMVFTLFDAESEGTAAVSITNAAVEVADGFYAVDLAIDPGLLDFTNCWIEIEARAAGSVDPLTTLSPRSRLTEVPYASSARRAASVQDGGVTSAAIAEGAVTGDKLAGQSVTLDKLDTTAAQAGQVPVFTGTEVGWQASGWGLNGNAGTVEGNYLGTSDLAPLELRVNDATALRLVPGEFGPNVIGGSGGNSVTSGASAATIAGGADNRVSGNAGTVAGGSLNVADSVGSSIGGGFGNNAEGSYSVVSGGQSNEAGVPYATIGGGAQNDILGQGGTIAGGRANEVSGENGVIGGGLQNTSSGSGSFVGGGQGNVSGGDGSAVTGGKNNSSAGIDASVGGGRGNQAGASFSSVSGGTNNIASGLASHVGGGSDNLTFGIRTVVGGGERNEAGGTHTVVGGGLLNLANGSYATVPGGLGNQASGRGSLAAGQSATAEHDGSFAWSDGSGSDWETTANNQFLIRASGGVGIGTNDPQVALDVAGEVHASEGFRFPDGSVQTTAAFQDWNFADNVLTAASNRLDILLGGQPALRLVPAGLSPNLIGGSNNSIGGDSAGSIVAGGYGNELNGNISAIGGGNRNTVSDSGATISGGANNVASSAYATVGGGHRNRASGSSSVVSGGLLNTASGGASSVGGGSGNQASNFGSVVSGGEQNTVSQINSGIVAGRMNRNQAEHSILSGGFRNLVQGSHNFLGAGQSNRIDATASMLGGGVGNVLNSDQSVLMGGTNNIQSGRLNVTGGGAGNHINGQYSVIGGGQANSVRSEHGTIAGGLFNDMSGAYGMIPGGLQNEVRGDYSFAAGRNAKAIHDGSFIWADKTGLDFGTTSEDQFLIRAAGGVGIGTNAPQSMLDVAGEIRSRQGYVFPDGTIQTTAVSGFSFASNRLTAAELVPLEMIVGSQRVLRLEPREFGPNLLGGDISNRSGTNASAATIGGGLDNTVNGGVSTISGGNFNRAQALGDTIGGGVGNEALGSISTIGGGQGNRAQGRGSVVGGGLFNQALGEAGVVAGGANNSQAGPYASVGGGNRNQSAGRGSTIGGGFRNRVDTDLGVVGGGGTNVAAAVGSVVAGGTANLAGGVHSSVGGGSGNNASGSFNAVAGGEKNTATGNHTTIGGGLLNRATGAYATVPGGLGNEAAQAGSFAAGRSAKAFHSGAFVWSDGGGVDFRSTANDQFLIRARGGVGIGTNAPQSALDVLGEIRSREGFVFPDGTVQTTAAFNGWGFTSNRLTATDANPLELAVGTQRVLRLEPRPSGPNLLGGDMSNRSGTNASAATIGGGLDNTVNGGVATISGGNFNRAEAIGDTVGGGVANTASGSLSTIGGGQGNSVAARGGVIGGGLFNEASGDGAAIGGGSNNELSGSHSVISGGTRNVVVGENSVIGGGRGNRAASPLAVVGGGGTNTANATGSVVTGGSNNRADGLYSGIGSGAGNVTGGSFNTVAGGENNRALGSHTFVGSGLLNIASGTYASVPGGLGNEAAGTGSFAAGRAAKSLHPGSFVWSDGAGADFRTTADNQFLIRSAGGVGVGTNAPKAQLHVRGTVRADAVQIGDSAPAGQVLTSTGNGIGTWGPAVSDERLLESVNSVLGSGSGINVDLLDGLDSTDFAPASHQHDDQYWGIGGNATGVGSAYLGSTDGEELQLGAGGLPLLRLIDTGGAPNLIAGHQGNAAAGGVAGVTVIGGGSESGANSASGDFATVTGGSGNLAGGLFSTVVGGSGNTATGDRSFAAGSNARASHPGSFVFSDSNNGSFSSSAPNQFSARAFGGVRLVTGGIPGAFEIGALLPSGSGSWMTMSDRDSKENVSPIDSREVLERVASLPMNTWNYKTQDQSVRHIGPMAQDFHAAFGLGESERHISNVDADGVALAAIKGLHEVVREKDREITELRERLDSMEQLLNRLSERESEK